jgi:hypothetical protein
MGLIVYKRNQNKLIAFYFNLNCVLRDDEVGEARFDFVRFRQEPGNLWVYQMYQKTMMIMETEKD